MRLKFICGFILLVFLSFSAPAQITKNCNAQQKTSAIGINKAGNIILNPRAGKKKLVNGVEITSGGANGGNTGNGDSFAYVVPSAAALDTALAVIGTNSAIDYNAFNLGYDQYKTGWFSLYRTTNQDDAGANQQLNSVFAFSGAAAAEGANKFWLPAGVYVGADDNARTFLSTDQNGLTIDKTVTVAGDVFVSDATKGIILKDSSDGTCRRIRLVGGVLSVSTIVTCPSGGAAAASIKYNVGGAGVAGWMDGGGWSSGSDNTDSNTVDRTGLTNPAPSAVYQSYHYIYSGSAQRTYTNLTPNDVYTVRLYFQSGSSATYQSVRTVSANGTAIAGNYNAWTSAGSILYKASIVEGKATADSSGNMVVTMTWVSGDAATLSGVEFVR